MTQTPYGHQIHIERHCPKCGQLLGAWTRKGAEPKPVSCPCERAKVAGCK